MPLPYSLCVSTKTAAPGSLRSVLAHRDFRLLLAGFGISSAGDWLYGVALVVFVFEETHSAGWVAAASILRLAPYVLLGVIGGVIADRYERRSVMIAADLARAGLMFALAVVATASWPVGIALLIAFLSTAAGTPYGPAQYALTPAVVGERDLAAANSLSSVVEEVALVVGPALGGLLLLLGSASVAFAINGATFLASAWCVYATRTRAAPTEKQAEKEGGFRAQVVEGFKAMTASSDVVLLVIVISASAFVYGAELVVLVLVSDELLGTGSEGVGYLTAAIGIGGIAAAALTGRLARDPRPGLTLVGASLLCAFPLAALALDPPLVIAYLLMAAEGAGSVVLEVIAITLLQRTLKPDLIGRVFGLIDSLVVAAILVGLFVAPVLVSTAGLKVSLIASAAIFPAVLLIVAPRLREMNRASRAKLDALKHRIEIISDLGIFYGASQRALEALADSAQERPFKKGEEIVREGEDAREFFVILTGELEVRSSGEVSSESVVVNRLGRHDYFGEIGLIERIPRTATVVAVTDGSVLRIEGEDFLNILNQAPALSPTLASAIAGRLSRTHPSHLPRPAATEEVV